VLGIALILCSAKCFARFFPESRRGLVRFFHLGRELLLRCAQCASALLIIEDLVRSTESRLLLLNSGEDLLEALLLDLTDLVVILVRCDVQTVELLRSRHASCTCHERRREEKESQTQRVDSFHESCRI
jgi:hypothetical protein